MPGERSAVSAATKKCSICRPWRCFVLLSPVTATAASTSECAFLASRASNEQYMLASYALIFVVTRNSPARRTASVQEGAVCTFAGAVPSIRCRKPLPRLRCMQNQAFYWLLTCFVDHWQARRNGTSMFAP